MKGRHAAPQVRIAADGDELTRLAVREVGDFLRRRLTRHPTVSIALSGGSTPGPVYAALAEPPYRYLVDWSRVRILWVDERCVPPGHPDSNYRLVAERLLDRLPVRPAVYRMPGEMPPMRGAQAYRHTLEDLFGAAFPEIDLVILGMGGDAHTASLFPGSTALTSRQTVLATRSPQPPHDRLTLGPRILNAARKTIFLVQGGGKAEVLAAVLAAASRGGKNGRYPAAMIRPPTPPVWFVDRPAAARLP